MPSRGPAPRLPRGICVPPPIVIALGRCQAPRMAGDSPWLLSLMNSAGLFLSFCGVGVRSEQLGGTARRATACPLRLCARPLQRGRSSPMLHEPGETTSRSGGREGPRKPQAPGGDWPVPAGRPRPVSGEAEGVGRTPLLAPAGSPRPQPGGTVPTKPRLR